MIFIYKNVVTNQIEETAFNFGVPLTKQLPKQILDQTIMQTASLNTAPQ